MRKLKSFRPLRLGIGQRTLLRMCVVGMGLLCPFLTAHGQSYIYQFGRYPWSAPSPVKLGYVDLANGNLHVEVPVAAMPERGRVPYRAALVYDSHIWQKVTAGGFSWQPTNVPGSWSGWRLITTGNEGSVAFASLANQCSYGRDHTRYDYTTYTGFVWTAPDGRQVSFPAMTSTSNLCHVGTTTITAAAADGSGFQIQVTSTTLATVFAPDGTQVFSNATGAIGTVEDTNGNYYSTDGNGNVTDTLGRTPVTTTTTNNGNTITYAVLDSKGDTYAVVVNLTTIPVYTSFGQSGVTEYVSTAPSTNYLTVVSSIVLPDGTSYTFGYDQGTTSGHYGVLTSAQLPTGGTVDYGYTVFSDAWGNKSDFLNSCRWGTPSGRWVYAPSVITSCGASCSQQVIVDKPKPFNGSNSEAHTFNFMAGVSSSTDQQPYDTQQQYYTGSGFNETLVSTISVIYTGTPLYPTTITTQVPISSTTNLTKQTVLSFTANNMGTVQTRQDWKFWSGSTPPVQPDRTTTNTYANVNNGMIVNKKASVAITGGGVSATTTIGYDSGTLATMTGITHHDDITFGTGYTARGNPTSITTTGFPGTIRAYDMTGQLISSTDAKGNTTGFSYADNFYSDNGANPPGTYSAASPTNAYLKTVTLPAPFNNWSLTLGYYFGSGKLAIAGDQTGQSSYHHTNWQGQDAWDRIIEAQRSTSWRLTDFTSATQADSYLGITDTSASVSCSACRHDQVQLDEWGRPVQQSLINDPEGQDFTKLTYNVASQIASATTPYRSTSDATYDVEAPGYDGLGRTTQVQHSDGNIVKSYYAAAVAGVAGAVTTQVCSVASYGSGVPVLSVDEAEKKREIWIDGFGKTIEVDEPDPVSGSLTGTNAVSTCYNYDVLGSLTKVTQGTQTRTYTYDGLERLTKAVTPESGTVTYCYFVANAQGQCPLTGGTICSANAAAPCGKTDNRGITTTYAYDALNRVTGTTYSDTTPAVTYTYDGTTQAERGRLTGMTDGSGSTSWTHDAMGRVLTQSRTILGMTKHLYYAWNGDGSLASVTYPSGRNINYNPVSNAQRYTQAMDTDGSKYAVTASYVALGALQSVFYGKVTGGFNGMNEGHYYNSRLEPCRAYASGDGSDPASCTDTTNKGNVLDLNFCYGAYSLSSAACTNPATGNDGNVNGITNNVTTGLSEAYTYDQLNRLDWGLTQSTTTNGCWGQIFGTAGTPEDRWSNLADMTTWVCSVGALDVTRESGYEPIH